MELFLKFLSNNPWISASIFVIIMSIIFVSLEIIRNGRRHSTIRSQGWPPEHCDSDGKFLSEED